MATTAKKPAAKSGRFDRTPPARENSSLVLVPRGKLTVRQGWNPRTVIESAELDDLAQSIVSRGMLTPLLVVATSDGFELVAGHRRVAAVDHAIADGRLPANTTLPAFLRDREAELADAVAENFNRVDLNPLEEAVAFGRMRDDMGLTAKGIAEQIGVAQRRVTERLRILELPASVQPHYGTGALPPASVGPLLKCAKVSAKLCERIVQVAVLPRDQRDGLGHQLYQVVGSYLTDDHGVESAAHAIASQYPKEFVNVSWRIDAAQLPWKGKPDVSSKIGQLAKDGWQDRAYVDVSDALQKSIEATGTVYGGVCVDPELVAAQVEPLVIKEHRALTRRTASAKAKAGIEPSAQEKADEAARAYAEQMHARSWNLKLGEALAKKYLRGVDPSLDVLALVAAMPALERVRGSMASEDQAAALGLCGLRYVLPQWQEEKTVKTTGRVKVTYVNDRDDARDRFWAWLDLANTPQEYAGRLVFALAAAVYADQACVAPSARANFSPFHWSAKDGPALVKKIAGRVAPPKTKPPAPPKKAAVKDESPRRVKVMPGKDVPAGTGEVRDAMLQPDRHPSNPEGLRKVIYVESKTAAWVDATRIVKPATRVPRGGTRAEVCGKLIREKPGITIPELAVAMQVKQNYLYRMLPALEQQGVIRKEGRGWHPVGADPDRAKQTELSALQARVLHALASDVIPAKGKTLTQTIRPTVNAKLDAVTEAIEQLRQLGLVADGEKAPYLTKQGGEVAAALTAKAA